MRYQVHIVYNGSCTEWIVIWSKIKYTGSSIWNYKCDFRSKLHETQFNYNSELPCLKILLQTSCCLHAKSVRSIIHPFPFVFNFLETKALKIYCTRLLYLTFFSNFIDYLNKPWNLIIFLCCFLICWKKDTIYSKD